MPDPTAENLDFTCVGLNHETSPLEVREKLALSPAEAARGIRALRERGRAEEALILSTCNRTELYACGIGSQPPAGLVTDLLREIKGADLSAHSNLLYAYHEPESIRHLFRVTSGLNSMILGEPQIAAQVKEALEVALEAGGAGPKTARVLDAALRCAKRARTETGIGRGPVSVAYAAVCLAEKVLGPLAGKRALIVGSGEIATLAARHLREAGIALAAVAGRTREHAEALAAELGGRGLGLDAIPALLPEIDVVASATSAPELVIHEDAVRPAMRARRNRPVLFLDLAVPRDVDPRVGRLPNVFLHDLDALGEIVAQSLEQRRAEVPRAEEIVEEEVRRFTRWVGARHLQPTIAAFRDRFEQVRREELAEHGGRFRPEDLPAVDSLTRAIIQRLLHLPTTLLHRVPEDGEAGLARLEALRDLFGLDGNHGNGSKESDDAHRDPR